MKGRKPKPLAVREAEGSKPRARHRNQPKPRAGKPTPPDHLSDAARVEWTRVLAAAPAGMLSRLDVAVLSLYCDAFARWAAARKMVARTGECIATTNGNVVQNPWLGIANRAAADTLKAAVELGLSPTARARVSVVAGKKDVADEDVEDIADFIGKGGLRLAE